MVKTWVRLIENGDKTVEDVPIKFRAAVIMQLIEDGFIEE